MCVRIDFSSVPSPVDILFYFVNRMKLPLGRSEINKQNFIHHTHVYQNCMMYLYDLDFYYEYEEDGVSAYCCSASSCVLRRMLSAHVHQTPQQKVYICFKNNHSESILNLSIYVYLPATYENLDKISKYSFYLLYLISSNRTNNPIAWW